MAGLRARPAVLLLASTIYFVLQGSDDKSAAFSNVAEFRDEKKLTGRRDALAASMLAGFSSSPTFAEESKPPPRGWQMKLPEGWEIYKQFGVPGGDEMRTKELLLAGDSKGTEVKVLRIPLQTTPQDPDGTAALTLIEYFQIPFPRVTRKTVVDSLSKAFARQKATYAFELEGDGEDRMKDKQKYLLYEFDLTRCEGRQVFGTNGKICQRRDVGGTAVSVPAWSDTGEILDTKKYHHLTINTVTPEPTQTAREAFSEVLWIVDISAPADNWGNLTKQVATMTKTFAVGTVEQLNAGRNTSSS
ncbi:unnamed protein product [Durusdinium trenchii]|uniref:PsbP C-terminal domain-containing protein n=2 Tax=Durusdinium trenchii TaxID=1381693 RepID=A0ABP0LR81_9DINO